MSLTLLSPVAGAGGDPDIVQPARPRVRLSLLPSFELRDEGGQVVDLPLGPQRVAALLALQRGAVLRGHVAGTLWPDSAEERASASLRSALWRLRRPGPTVVEATTTHLRLARSVTVDLDETTARVRRLLDASAWVPADLDAELSCDLLTDWYDEWLAVDRERYRQLRLHALEVLTERLTQTGRFSAAVQAGLAAVAAEPLRESAHRVLVKAHLAEGNVGEAIRQYQSYRSLLARELGLQPSPLFQALVAALPVA